MWAIIFAAMAVLLSCLKLFLIAWVLLLLIDMPVQAQHLHAGRVLANDGSSIPGARVCEGISNCVVSDSLGRFSLLANRPEIILSVYRAGHQPEMHTFRQEDTLLIVRISPIPVFSEVTVQAFDTRLRTKEVPAAVGILTRSDLARFSNTGFVAAVNTVPGVKMDERSPGSFRLSIRGNLLRSPFGIRLSLIHI